MSELCRILEVQSSAPSDLAELPDRLPNLLTIDTDEARGQVGLDFRAESLRHRIRRLRPVDHRAIVTALTRSLGPRSDSIMDVPDPVTTYSERTPGLHAVHAGLLDEVLSNGSVLAYLDPTGILPALAVRWPKGIPRAASLWTSTTWNGGTGHGAAGGVGLRLHHSALSRGDEASRRP